MKCNYFIKNFLSNIWLKLAGYGYVLNLNTPDLFNPLSAKGRYSGPKVHVFESLKN